MIRFKVNRFRAAFSDITAHFLRRCTNAQSLWWGEICKIVLQCFASVIFLMSWPGNGSAQDFPGLYDASKTKTFPGLYTADDLRNVNAFFQQQIDNVVVESIRPALKGERLKTFNMAKFDFPAQGVPFGFYAGGSTITLPIPSLVFAQDLITAYVWEDINHCQSNVMPYLTMLKYRAAGSFPGGIFPDPIKALGIPSPNTGTLARMNPEFAPRLERLMYGALLFITAHEAGHVVLHHVGFPEISKEIAADNFALDIMAQNQIDPSGVMVLFMLSSVFLPSEAELQASQLKANHPMNGSRVRAIGMRLSEHSAQFYPGAGSDDPRIPLLKLEGTKLIEMSKSIDDLSEDKRLEDFALRTEPSELAACQSKLTVPPK